MNKIDYLFQCFERRLYQKKLWILSAFSILTDNEKNETLLGKTPWFLHRSPNGLWCYNDDGDTIEIEGDLAYPLFYKHEKLVIDNKWHPSIEGSITTTMGILLLNRCLFWEVFQNRTPYHNKLITGRLVEDVIAELMVDDPQPGEAVPAGKASVTECLKVTKQANYLMGLNDIFTKAGSIQAVTVSKAVIALRERLFKEHAHELNDPIVAANIIKQIVDLDMEEQLNGASSDFFIDKKFIDNARKKMFLVFGLERDFNTGEFILIKQPLNEIWNYDQITHYINTAVSASYDRGKATGEGGAGVKELMRLTSRIIVAEDDCGTTYTEDVYIDPYSLKNWKGGYYLKNGKPTVLEGTETEMIGSTVKMRVPYLCQTKEDNHCKVCCGVSLGKSANRLSSEVVNIPTRFMLTKMKNAHVSKVETTVLNLYDSLF